ncbi:MAG: ATP-binding protein [Deltaproteobacteria bacterium]|nr:ATP-binding protein [Deltaproteobacteria bacterium]
MPGWERFVRRLLDEGRVQVLVTGSSSKLLSTEIATGLRGGALATEILPFSFGEVLLHAKERICVREAGGRRSSARDPGLSRAPTAGRPGARVLHNGGRLRGRLLWPRSRGPPAPRAGLRGPVRPRDRVRESALESAMAELGIDDATLVTRDDEGEEQVGAGRVRLVPAWIWTLQVDDRAG